MNSIHNWVHFHLFHCLACKDSKGNTDFIFPPLLSSNQHTHLQHPFRVVLGFFFYNFQLSIEPSWRKGSVLLGDPVILAIGQMYDLPIYTPRELRKTILPCGGNCMAAFLKDLDCWTLNFVQHNPVDVFLLRVRCFPSRRHWTSVNLSSRDSCDI